MKFKTKRSIIISTESAKYSSKHMNSLEKESNSQYVRVKETNVCVQVTSSYVYIANVNRTYSEKKTLTQQLHPMTDEQIINFL